jgi:8-oxo-dGTP pyrophosphatase MutT (NUDIX family)
MSHSSSPAATDAAVEVSAKPVEPRPAATVLLVRDTTEGVEVFLMKRSGFGMFGGLHVFPGGKVDAADHGERWSALTRGPNDAQASQILGLTRGGLDYWIACIRECFEEAGILLAIDQGDEPLRLTDPDRRQRIAAWRGRLNAREKHILEGLCESEALRLATDQLAYLSHWITPISQPARFNTRFFVARAPTDQVALHDGHETVESEWLRPEVALDRFAAGELKIISPTEKNLQAICGFTSTEALLESKRQIDPATIPTILPRVTPKGDSDFEEVLEVIGHGGVPKPS